MKALIAITPFQQGGKGTVNLREGSLAALLSIDPKQSSPGPSHRRKIRKIYEETVRQSEQRGAGRHNSCLDWHHKSAASLPLSPPSAARN